MIPASMPLARIRVEDHGASCHLETTISTNHREEIGSDLDSNKSVVSISLFSSGVFWACFVSGFFFSVAGLLRLASPSSSSLLG